MIIPINDNILLDITEKKAESTTSFGLLLVNEQTSKPQNKGVVEAIGEKVEGIKVGDEVLYDKWSGNIFEELDKKLILIKAQSILAKIIL